MDTLHCRGYGFVEYHCNRQAENALSSKLNGLDLGGERLIAGKVSRSDVEKLLIEQYVYPQYISDG